MGIAVGIDLGTTNSAVACLDKHGKPAVIQDGLGEPIIPSVVCFKEGKIIVGREAKELQATGEPVAAFFKRQMGVPNFVFYAEGRDYSAIELSALVLKELKGIAENFLKQAVSDAVVTVPAYFRNLQREATIAAGREAGFNVLQVINEPTAAAVAYGFQKVSKEQKLLVYDLGGGTFDVTLLRLDGEETRILTSDGDHELGGKDWDDRIVEFLGTRFSEEFGIDPFGDAVSLSELLIKAEAAKKRLSSAESTRVSIVHGGNQGRYELDRATFEKITYDLMERTMSLTHKVLLDKGMEAGEIDGVLLVGGSTRMPMVHDFVARTFGRPPLGGVNVDEAVALGAAVVAAERAESLAPRKTFALAGRRRTIDVTNHSLGMIAVNENGTAFLNSIILPKDAVIPCVQTRPYQHRTRQRGQNRLEIYMTQGESESPADVAYLGRHVVADIPFHQGGLAVIDVEYGYDASGTVNVLARLRSSGALLEVVLEPLPDDVPDRFLKSPQESAQEHVTAYLAFDLSGSMSGAPLAEAKKSAMGFLHNIDLTHCSLGIIAFADRVKTKLEASQNARKIEKAINELNIGETGGGNDAHPFDEALRLLSQASGPAFLITLADGVWSHQNRAVEQAKKCHQQGIEIIAVGFGGADKDFLKAIASSDEGSFFTSLGELAETFSSIAQVLTESGGGTVLPEGRGTRGNKTYLGFLKRK